MGRNDTYYFRIISAWSLEKRGMQEDASFSTEIPEVSTRKETQTSSMRPSASFICLRTNVADSLTRMQSVSHNMIRYAKITCKYRISFLRVVELSPFNNGGGVLALAAHILKKIGTIQRRLAWALYKDDMQICEAFHIFKNKKINNGGGNSG